MKMTKRSTGGSHWRFTYSGPFQLPMPALNELSTKSTNKMGLFMHKHMINDKKKFSVICNITIVNIEFE